VQVERSHVSLSRLDDRITRLFFGFSVSNTFLQAVLGGAAFQQMGAMLSSPGDLWQLLGTSIPAASNWVLNYTIQHALMINRERSALLAARGCRRHVCPPTARPSAPFNTRHPPLAAFRFCWPHDGTVLFVFFRAAGLFRPTCQRDHTMVRTAPSYRAGRHYGAFFVSRRRQLPVPPPARPCRPVMALQRCVQRPQLTCHCPFSRPQLTFVFGLSYSLIAPLVLPAAYVYFLTAWVTWRYSALFFYQCSYESDGRILETLLELMWWTLWCGAAGAAARLMPCLSLLNLARSCPAARGPEASPSCTLRRPNPQTSTATCFPDACSPAAGSPPSLSALCSWQSRATWRRACWH
jgi:hypothetical protein